MNQIRPTAHAAWHAAVEHRVRWRRIVAFALSTGLGCVVAVIAVRLRSADVPPVPVATVARIDGNPYVSTHSAMHRAVVPQFDIADRSLDAFLHWAARETGRKLTYVDTAAQTAAERVKLRGSIAGLSPDVALAAVLSTTQLRRIETNDELISIALTAD
jgi:hypothetical protein